jgi:hypothetical protein
MGHPERSCFSSGATDLPSTKLLLGRSPFDSASLGSSFAQGRLSGGEQKRGLSG